MRLLDFYNAWDYHKPDLYLRCKYEKEIVEALKQDWIFLGQLSGKPILMTEKGLSFFVQLRGHFENFSLAAANFYNSKRLQYQDDLSVNPALRFRKIGEVYHETFGLH